MSTRKIDVLLEENLSNISILLYLELLLLHNTEHWHQTRLALIKQRDVHFLEHYLNQLLEWGLEFTFPLTKWEVVGSPVVDLTISEK